MALSPFSIRKTGMRVIAFGMGNPMCFFVCLRDSILVPIKSCPFLFCYSDIMINFAAEQTTVTCKVILFYILVYKVYILLSLFLLSSSCASFYVRNNHSVGLVERIVFKRLEVGFRHLYR